MHRPSTTSRSNSTALASTRRNQAEGSRSSELVIRCSGTQASECSELASFKAPKGGAHEPLAPHKPYRWSNCSSHLPSSAWNGACTGRRCRSHELSLSEAFVSEWVWPASMTSMSIWGAAWRRRHGFRLPPSTRSAEGLHRVIVPTDPNHNSQSKKVTGAPLEVAWKLHSEAKLKEASEPACEPAAATTRCFGLASPRRRDGTRWR